MLYEEKSGNPVHPCLNHVSKLKSGHRSRFAFCLKQALREHV
jgi:hypothetical protein